MFSRDGSLLPSVYADARYIDCRSCFTGPPLLPGGSDQADAHGTSNDEAECAALAPERLPVLARRVQALPAADTDVLDGEGSD